MEFTSAHWQIPVHKAHIFKPKAQCYAVIVIVWNEGERIRAQLLQMQSQLPFVDIIIVDGYSNDGSTEHRYLQQMNVTALLQTHERGLGCALRVGIAHALLQGYEGVVTIDGNNKDGTELLEQMTIQLKKGMDLVQASRFKAGGTHYNTPLERYIGVRFIIAPLLALGCGFWFTDPTNGFKGFSKKYLLHPNVQPFRKVFIRFNMQFYLNYRAPKVGLRVTEIPASRGYPADGSVPTKIHGIASKWAIVWELLLTIVGRYNPKL